MKAKFISIILSLLVVAIFSAPAPLKSQEQEAEKTQGRERIEEVFKDTKVMFVGENLYTVSIASRREEPLSRAPAAVTVIAGEDLSPRNTRFLSGDDGWGPLLQ
jgi:hypothetical protein